MAVKITIFVLLLSVLVSCDSNNKNAEKESASIDTVVGTGAKGFDGDDGLAKTASLNQPIDVTVDSAGNLYIADQKNHRIRKVDFDSGIISTVAGTSEGGFIGNGGLATAARLKDPADVEVDAQGNLFIADNANQQIRRVDAHTGIIEAVAGNGKAGFRGDGGPAVAAELNDPRDVALDSAGNLYIADEANQRIRRVDAKTGEILTVVGNGQAGFSGDDGPAIDARLWTPRGLTVDQHGNLYIAEWDNNRVRRVDAKTGVITTVAGNGKAGFSGDGGAATAASLSKPSDVAIDVQGNMYISDVGNRRIRRVQLASGIITTAALSGKLGFSGDGGPALEAGGTQLPYAIAVTARGDLLLADTNGQRIRRVTFNAAR